MSVIRRNSPNYRSARYGAEQGRSAWGYLREKDGDERKDEGVAVVEGEAVVPIVFVGRCGDGLSR